MHTATPMRPAPPDRVKWLRANLALAAFGLSMISAIIGGVISGTVRVVDYDNRLSSLERVQRELASSVSSFDSGRQVREAARAAETHDRDARIDALNAKVLDMRHDFDAQSASLSQRAALLEMQTRFIGEAVHDAQGAIVAQRKVGR